MFAKAGCLMLVAAVSTSHMVDDESGLLVSKKIQVHDDLDHDLENSYCNTVFHNSGDATKSTCADCVAEGKAEGDTKDYSKSPAFVAGVMNCMVTKAATYHGMAAATVVENMATTAGLGAEFAVCKSIHGAGGAMACANTVAQCGAVHWTKAISTCAASDPAGKLTCIMKSHGFLGCVASRAEYQRCLTSPLGVGLCMEKGLACIKDATKTDKLQCLSDAESAFLNAPENAPLYNAAQLCQKYYAYANATDKCEGCALQAVSQFGNGCSGERCLLIPDFVQDITGCMMLPPDPALPDGYTSAEKTCEKAFPNVIPQCLKSAARCLSLHPCETGLDCIQSDAWAYCFARKMEFEACHAHHAGVAACMAVGLKCLNQDHCTGGAASCLNSQQFLDCHRDHFD